MPEAEIRLGGPKHKVFVPRIGNCNFWSTSMYDIPMHAGAWVCMMMHTYAWFLNRAQACIAKLSIFSNSYHLHYCWSLYDK